MIFSNKYVFYNRHIKTWWASVFSSNRNEQILKNEMNKQNGDIIRFDEEDKESHRYKIWKRLIFQGQTAKRARKNSHYLVIVISYYTLSRLDVYIIHNQRESWMSWGCLFIIKKNIFMTIHKATHEIKNYKYSLYGDPIYLLYAHT